MGRKCGEWVINIITKSARETQGIYFQAGAGSEENNDQEAQYGGRIGSKGYYRAFGHYFSFGALSNDQNQNAADGWWMRHAGFRTDWDVSGRDSLMVEGDLYQTNEGQTIQTPLSTQGFAYRIFNDQFNSTGGSVLTRWDHTFSGGSETSLQFYEMGHTRGDNGARERFNIVDLSFEHHFHVGSRHDLVWGLDYRYNHGSMRAGYAVSMSPPVRNFNLFSGFVQDQIRLTDSLWFTLGSKLEHNPFRVSRMNPVPAWPGPLMIIRHYGWQPPKPFVSRLCLMKGFELIPPRSPCRQASWG